MQLFEKDERKGLRSIDFSPATFLVAERRSFSAQERVSSAKMWQ